MKLTLPHKNPAKVGSKIVLARAFGLLLALSMIVISATPALAVPSPDHWFRGFVRVTNAPGTPVVPESTKVTAEINDVEYADTVVDALGRYGYTTFFSVPSDDPDTPAVEGGVDDQEVKFYVWSDGEKILSGTAVFKSGNHDDVDLAVVDNIPPTVTINPLDPDPTGDNTPTFTGTATDGLCAISAATVEYMLDDSGTWLPATAVDGAFDEPVEDYEFTTAILLDGEHRVDVRATDIANNTTQEANYASDTFTVTTEDLTPPEVQATTPDDGATDVAVDAGVTATFNEDVTTVNLAGITVDGIAVAPTLNEATDTITIAHDDFAEGVVYTVTIPAGAVEDLAGNPNAVYTWSFTTVGPDATPPEVQATTPDDGATDIAVDAGVTATFNEDVTAVNLAGITVDGIAVAPTLNEATDTITIAHDDFTQGVEYTVTIPAGAVQDLAGNPNAAYTWSFTTLFPETVYTVQLGAGWNTFSTPIALDPSTDTWGEFAALGDGLNFNAAYSYDGTFNWVDANYELLPCDAIYVNMVTADTAPIIAGTYTSGGPEKDVDIGWNLVGSAFLEQEEFPVTDALISLYFAPGGFWGYSQVVSPGVNQTYWVYTRDGATIPNMLVGKGYWVSMENPDIYTGQTFTPWPGP